MVRGINMQVVALIHEEDGVYGASFPDFAGCTTVASDPEAIFAKAAEVLAFHVEGMVEDGLELPSVRSLAQLRQDAGFCEDAEGAMIAMIPYAPPTRAARINITLEESLLSRVDRAAESEGRTRSGFIADALRERLEARAVAGRRSAGKEAGRPKRHARRAATKAR
jgi:predicted RNase H-like HicB family nuclease/predicted transcriptional regulator